MVLTLIMKCPNCTGLFLAGAIQKTKICPYCCKSVNLQRAVCVAKAESSMVASEVLKQLKAKNAQNPHPKFKG